MIFNPLFLQSAADPEFVQNQKPQKVNEFNYLFSDIIKVQLSDIKETLNKNSLGAEQSLTVEGLTETSYNVQDTELSTNLSADIKDILSKLPVEIQEKVEALSAKNENKIYAKSFNLSRDEYENLINGLQDLLNKEKLKDGEDQNSDLITSLLGLLNLVNTDKITENGGVVLLNTESKAVDIDLQISKSPNTTSAKTEGIISSTEEKLNNSVYKTSIMINTKATKPNGSAEVLNSDNAKVTTGNVNTSEIVSELKSEAATEGIKLSAKTAIENKFTVTKTNGDIKSITGTIEANKEFVSGIKKIPPTPNNGLIEAAELKSNSKSEILNSLTGVEEQKTEIKTAAKVGVKLNVNPTDLQTSKTEKSADVVGVNETKANNVSVEEKQVPAEKNVKTQNLTSETKIISDNAKPKEALVNNTPLEKNNEANSNTTIQETVKTNDLNSSDKSKTILTAETDLSKENKKVKQNESIPIEKKTVEQKVAENKTEIKLDSKVTQVEEKVEDNKQPIVAKTNSVNEKTVTVEKEIKENSTEEISKNVKPAEVAKPEGVKHTDAKVDKNDNAVKNENVIQKDAENSQSLNQENDSSKQERQLHQASTNAKVSAENKISNEHVSFDKELETSRNSERIVKSTEVIKELSKFIQKQDATSITLRINPESFGKLKLVIQSVEQVVQANIEVESEAAKHLLEKNIGDLQSQLIKSGLQLGSVNISLGDSNSKSSKSSNSSKNKGGKFSNKEEIIEENDSSNKKSLGYNTYDFIA